jgi:hypothetical protein
MSPYRIKGKGSLRVDRHFKGVGRLQKSTGVYDLPSYRNINTMLTQLYRTGKHDVLREIISGHVSILEVYGYWTDGKLDHLPSAASLQLVDPSVFNWIDDHYNIETTRRNYKSAVSRLVSEVGNIPIQELPEGVKQYRVHCSQEDKPRAFNFLRTAIMAFLHHNFGRASFLWASVREIPRLEEDEPDQAPQLSVAEANDLITKLPPQHADIAEAMLYTGMHWKELVDKWEVRSDDRVWILGAKKKRGKRRTREVPLIKKIKRPQRGNLAFRRALRKVRDDLSPYSFRRTYMHWMEEAKVPRSRRLAYLGHSVLTDDSGNRYEKHEVTRFLSKDAKTIKKYLLWASRPQLKIEMPESPFLEL